MEIKIKKVRDTAIIPRYQIEGDSGFDFHAAEDCFIHPESTGIMVPTGLAFQIPKGYELQIRPRSGMSVKTPIRVSNSPGTIDSNFRGEVCILFDNISSWTGHYIKRGDRIAQGVICPVVRAEFNVVSHLDETKRAGGGFGSTGV